MFLISSLFIVGCSPSIQQMGNIGPKHLKVYSIAKDDFLTSNRMLVVLNDKGDIAAYSGGTVAGGGQVGLSTAASIATSGAMIYGANALEHGLENVKATTTVKGIPKSVDINANIHASGTLERK